LSFHRRACISNPVGRTYLFECPYCQYRAKISGGADSGLHCQVQTVVCRDCRELFDVFTRVRRRAGAGATGRFRGFYRPEIPPPVLVDNSRPPAQPKPAPLVWEPRKPACPVDPTHRVEPWKDPGRCPRCGNFVEKSGLPFRLWD
jgi:hypothetical protein